MAHIYHPVSLLEESAAIQQEADKLVLNFTLNSKLKNRKVLIVFLSH